MVEKFKIRKINEFYNRFVVEIEFKEDGERRTFGYPLGEGWEQKINGKPRFVDDIKVRLEKEEVAKKNTDLKSIKKEFEGKTF